MMHKSLNSESWYAWFLFYYHPKTPGCDHCHVCDNYPSTSFIFGLLAFKFFLIFSYFKNIYLSMWKFYKYNLTIFRQQINLKTRREIRVNFCKFHIDIFIICFKQENKTISIKKKEISIDPCLVTFTKYWLDLWQ